MNTVITLIKTRFLAPGPITAIFTFVGTVLALFNMPALAAWFNDPATASAVVNLLTSVGALAAGFLAASKAPKA